MATLVVPDTFENLPATLAFSVKVTLLPAFTVPLVALNVKVGVALLIVKAFVVPVNV